MGENQKHTAQEESTGRANYIHGTKTAPTLTPRLQLIADWVPKGARVADVGTDHAYLPVWLLLTGRAVHAIASDLRKGPLERAKETARTYGVPQLDCRLGDGLAFISPEEADVITIAGMGGETIISILSAAPWTRDGTHTLLIQPMTHTPELRRYLCENGYVIHREALVYDRGTIYPVMEVSAGEMTLTLGQLWGGAKLSQDPLADRYMIMQIIRLQMAVAGLNRSRRESDQKRAEELRDIITALLEMREELRKHGKNRRTHN